MGDLIVELLDGLAWAALVYIVTLGLWLILGMLDTLDVAHGGLYLLGSYLAFEVSTRSVGGYLEAVLLAVVLGGGLGAAIYGMLRPLRGQSLLMQLLLTLGITFIIGDLITWKWGGNNQSVEPPSPLAGTVGIGDVSYPVYRLVVMGIGVTMFIAAYLVINKTLLGAVFRAIVADRGMATAVGINVERAVGLTVVIGSILAVVAGVLGAPILGAVPGLDSEILLLALVVVVIGGIRSTVGLAVSALVVGQIQTVGVIHVPAAISGSLLFFVMAIVIILPNNAAALRAARAAAGRLMKGPTSRAGFE